MRIENYARASSALATLSNAELTELIASGKAGPVGVGGSTSVVDVDGVPVFVKRVPLTDRELRNPFSTANLFDLPVVCQYGIGSPGFSAWRELTANQIVTTAMLTGEDLGFPLLYHQWVLPGRAPVADEFADIAAAAKRLGDSPQIRARFAELVDAKNSLVLFFEHIPLGMREWLTPELVPEAERQLMEIVSALRSKDLLHLDVHFGNIRSDGSRLYLADFGLATSPRFELSDEELAFAEEHTAHDAELVALHLVNFLERAGELTRAAAEMLERLGPTAARLNEFYERLMAQSGQ